MEKEQKRVDLISEEVEEQLRKWHDADPEKRAVIVIAIEDEGDAAHVENYINGKGGTLVEAIYSTLSDNDKENKLASLMRRAVMMYSLEGACNSLEGALNSLEHFTKKLEAMMNSGEETSDKEGKQ